VKSRVSVGATSWQNWGLMAMPYRRCMLDSDEHADNIILIMDVLMACIIGGRYASGCGNMSL
jgi:hypothetical protein